MKLQNKFAVITGGSSGIGLATAKELNQNRALVIINGRDAEAVNKAASELGSDRPMEDIHDLEEYLFVSTFYLNDSYRANTIQSMLPTNFTHADDRLVK